MRTRWNSGAHQNKQNQNVKFQRQSQQRSRHTVHTTHFCKKEMKVVRGAPSPPPPPPTDNF